MEKGGERSVAQKWAAERTGRKTQLRAVKERLSDLEHEAEILLNVEKQKIRLALTVLEPVFENWEKRNLLSKRAYLKRIEDERRYPA